MLDGELTANEFQETETHLAGCASCRDELGWLRTERRLLSARRQAEPSLPADGWAALQRKLAENRRPVESPRQKKAPLFWGIFGGFATLTAAAAAFVALLMPHPVDVKPTGEVAEIGSKVEPDPVTPPDPERPQRARRNLAQAERQYRSAIRELEADYNARRPSLPRETVAKLDQQFYDLRETIVQARRDSGANPQGRRRTLDAYAAYVRSMQRVALDQELL
jgi:hypothetical protein